MHITLVAVVSADGKLTKWNDDLAESWSSIEDQKYFGSLIAESSLIIMGSGTYDIVKSTIAHSAGRLRVILTSEPSKYKGAELSGQLEFWSETPIEVVKKLEDMGHNEALLVGGEVVHGAFLEAKLVNEMWLTVEPKIFGIGKSFAGGVKLDVEMRLVGHEKLNSDGTMLLKYEVL